MHSLHELITSVHNWRARVYAGFLLRRVVMLQKQLEIFRYKEKL